MERMRPRRCAWAPTDPNHVLAKIWVVISSPSRASKMSHQVTESERKLSFSRTYRRIIEAGCRTQFHRPGQYLHIPESIPCESIIMFGTNTRATYSLFTNRPFGPHRRHISSIWLANNSEARTVMSQTSTSTPRQGPESKSSSGQWTWIVLTVATRCLG